MSTDRTDLVSISELHRRLTEAGQKTNRSTLSRYVTRYADALNPVRQGRDTLVSFSAFVAHRGENLNVADEAPYAERKQGAAAKARKEEADAGIREIDLAERRGLLTSVTEVRAAGLEAIAKMSGAFDIALQDTAERLASATGADPRIIRPHLRKLKEQAFDEFRRSLTASLKIEAAADGGA